jgi:hypothetical protein
MADISNTKSDRREEEKENIEINKERGENEPTQVKNTKKEEEDTSKGINISSPINASNWEQIINLIAPDPSKHVLTKENEALLSSHVTALEYVILRNLYDHIKDRSLDPNFYERLKKFLVILKIAPSLLQFKQNRLNAILEAIKSQERMYIAVVNAIAQITQVTPNFNPFNIQGNIKWSASFTALITALAAIGLEIGGLKNDLRALINNDEFCIEPCSSSIVNRIELQKSEGDKINLNEITDKILKEVDIMLEKLKEEDIKGYMNKVK